MKQLLNVSYTNSLIPSNCWLNEAPPLNGGSGNNGGEYIEEIKKAKYYPLQDENGEGNKEGKVTLNSSLKFEC